MADGAETPGPEKPAIRCLELLAEREVDLEIDVPMGRTANIPEARRGGDPSACPRGKTDRIADDVVEPKIAPLERQRAEVEIHRGRIGELNIPVDAPNGRGGKIEPQIADVGLKELVERRNGVLERAEAAIGETPEKMKLIDVAEPGLHL